jgi:thiamine biosynthesis lipoprotein
VINRLAPHPWLRRARPLLGTLVEVAIARSGAHDDAAIDAAFGAIAEVQACLSRFDAHSDVARFHALRAGQSLELRPHTAQVLAAAQALRDASVGLFDISVGTAPTGWRRDAAQLYKLSDAVRLDLGGIGKGHAVDVAVDALMQRGCRAGWVNAGGDLRVFGDAELPVSVRDESAGGVRPFATLAEGAFATSCLEHAGRRAHASVAAPRCLWADALTKVVALSGDAAHPLLARHGAQAWLH